MVKAFLKILKCMAFNYYDESFLHDKVAWHTICKHTQEIVLFREFYEGEILMNMKDMIVPEQMNFRFCN